MFQYAAHCYGGCVAFSTSRETLQSPLGWIEQFPSWVVVVLASEQ